MGVKKINERSLNLPFSSLLQFFMKKDNFTWVKERKKAWVKTAAIFARMNEVHNQTPETFYRGSEPREYLGVL